ncbi:kinesin-like protein KIF14 isoform X2 [Argopecten irradians]|uniref:kinesin-like protein KIF14 isoform X2 n=1 Tax=Argopecten irradians TaxID=31199 RepID=UPI0037152782
MKELHSYQIFRPPRFLQKVKQAARRVTVEGHVDSSSSIVGEYSPGMKSTPVRRFTLDNKLLSTPECYSTVQMDLPCYQMSCDKFRGDFMGLDDEDSSSVTVAVRMRPFLQREIGDHLSRCMVSMSGNEASVTTSSGILHKFAYDYAFNSLDNNLGDYASQEHVYRLLAQPLLGKAFEGYNTCLFAYGQTGSGKSYSIMGHGNEVGIIPRFCEELFCRADVTRDSDKVKINVEISFFEIYNEKIHDLLASYKDKGGKKPTLKVREHPSLGPYVEGLSTYVTNSFEDVEAWINLGNKNRATAATGMNDKSSRSHSVFTLVLTQTKTEELEGEEHDHSTTSKINLVDLAGSERQSQANTSGQRLREGANINKSLLTLGKVISSLSDQALSNNRKRKPYIPYRDSVLTWLLKESLGGNSKTAMIATISPSCQHIEETLSTLRYASQARSIVNIARVNEDPKAKIIRELRAEIERLKNHSVYMTDDTHTASLVEIASLKERLLTREREMEEITRSWQQRLQQSEERKVAESKQLEKSGVAFKVDNKQPNLVNLNEDPQLSEMLLYIIREGQTRVGRMCASSDHEIQLSGALIADNHCIINNVDSVVTVTPIGDAPTYVNGNSISEPSILHHGDRVILGGDHYFRFNHPKEVTNKVPANNHEMRDFDFARQELIQVQEARLQAELEEARRQAQEEMMQEVEKARKEAEQVLNTQKSGYEGKLKKLEKVVKDQSQEVQRAEQSRQEAQGLIEELKKQKIMLEQQVVAGRRRQEMEAKVAKKVADHVPSKKTPLIMLLEEEKQKVTMKLESLKQKRQETSLSKRYQDVHPGKTDLYKVALLLREANKISQYLRKNMEFTREDYMEEANHVKTLIKVTDTNLAVCTFWTLPKFEEKLMQMRDLYQNDADNSTDDEVFHDPGDTWEHDQKNSPCKSPRSYNTSLGFSPSQWSQSSTLCSVSSLNSTYRSNGDLNTGMASISDLHSGMTSVSELHSGMTSISDLQPSVDQEIQTSSNVQIASLCIKLVRDHIDSCHGFYYEESIGDKLLSCCDKILKGVKVIQNYSQHSQTSFTDCGESLEKTSLELVSLLQSLTSLWAIWSSMYTGQYSAISSLTDRFRGQVKVIGNQLVLLFQGCQGDLERLVEDSGVKLRDGVLDVCQLVGEMSLATDMAMLTLDRCAKEQEPVLCGEVCQAFLSGCDVLVDKSLQSAIRTMEEHERRAQEFTEASAPYQKLEEVPQNVKILISTCKILLNKCQTIQMEVDLSLKDGGDCVPSQYYSLGYRRSQGMVSQVNNLLDTVSLLLQSVTPVMEGKTDDVRKVCRCSELIQKGTAKLMAVSGQDTSTLLQTSCSSDLTNISVLSDSQTERLEFAAQDVNLAAGALIEQAKDIIDLEKLIATPRGKRLLPVSPEKGGNSFLNSPLRSMSVKRNISLLASAGHS